MKYHLYDEKERHQGTFKSVQELRNFLCDRKYSINCDKDADYNAVIECIIEDLKL